VTWPNPSSIATAGPAPLLKLWPALVPLALEAALLH
jgi:hypothetical protein